MITDWDPKYILLAGFLLVLLGFLLPFLMIAQIIQLTTLPYFVSLLLILISFISSVLGLFLGFIGSALLYKANKK
jgi:hypothetical protein